MREIATTNHVGVTVTDIEQAVVAEGAPLVPVWVGQR